MTPGLRRKSNGSPSFSRVVVDTTLTAPDCRVPPTVMDVPSIATLILGKAGPCPELAAIAAPLTPKTAAAAKVIDLIGSSFVTEMG